MNDILKELIDTDEELQALIELGYTIEEDHDQADSVSQPKPSAQPYPVDLKIH
ncbi:hypothetical protein G7032_06505 [Pseudomonas monteilii]|uniref:hypothetical protein n=1 Tax=Pseudomonas TaxID=286 RepID=UPI000AB00858|nr:MULTISPECIES: hypothetical protein [Pseudomonas]MBA1315515.1 hypothetical protein [Pseudomonas monteilii]MQT51133.1 hypothetical protein [Pseudomonas sp. FSL R10-2398]WHT80176.1 hypothetical protein QMY54_04995 [Pseudomonas rhodesiae]